MNDIEKAINQLRSGERYGAERISDDTIKDANLVRGETLLKRVDVYLESANDVEQRNSSIPQLSKFNAANQSTEKCSLGTGNNAENSKTPFLCKLPLRKMQQAGFITPKTEKGRLTEEFRKIKRPLLKNLQNDEIPNGLRNVIAVTSSVAGEGKTYSAINLAMSMAIEKERTVLLVDADAVKGAAGRLLEIAPGRPGLINVLQDDSVDISDAIIQTNVKNMRFMPAGDSVSNINELLSSNAMSELVIELARRYDDRIIILDCPPMLQTNEANILVDHAGQVLFVVAEADTRPKLVQNALDQIDKKKYVGIVLNKSTNRIGNYDYYRSAYY